MAETRIKDLRWVDGMTDVLKLVARERVEQVCRYGHNDDLENGTGPDVRWLLANNLNQASDVEELFRENYEEHEAKHGKPTWMHLVREEIAEAFQESDPERLAEELIQVAALCVSWVETLRKETL